MAETKFDQLTDRLQKRADTRLAEQEKKKAEREWATAAKEQNDFYNSNFTQMKKDVYKKLDECQCADKSEALRILETISRDYQKLEKLLAESTMFLPSYDIRVAQETLKNIQEAIQEAENKFLPKKKFAFKNKRKAAVGKDRIDSLIKSNVRQERKFDINDCGFKKLSNMNLEMNQNEVNKKDVGLNSLENCTVRIYGTPSTVHASGLRGCTVLIGPVSTSMFIENCADCIFAVACQQLRVHTTSRVTFYLHVTSRAIIEDSTELKFAPYSWDYKELDEHFELAGLNKTQNNWNMVDDFNWLALDVPSPNWSVLKEDMRVTSW